MEDRFALLIDADNVSAKYIKPILDELSKYGNVTYKRIYGDWTKTNNASWKEELPHHSLNPIQHFSYTHGKNATDSAMIIDAMDMLYTIRIQFGDFKVRDYGYSQFKQYIQSFPKVELIEDGERTRCLCGRLKVERIRYRRGAD